MSAIRRDEKHMNETTSLPHQPKLYPEGMVQLNDSAAEILKRCDGERSLEAIVDELETAFNVSDLRPQVISLLEEGQRRGWID
jgi:pyrroloquinoline quinone biosynthesis protein D